MRWRCGFIVGACLVGIVRTPLAQEAESAEALIQKGLSLRRSGDDVAALPHFRRAYDREPSARATAQLGLVEQATGRWLDAEEHLATSLRFTTDVWIQKNRTVLEESLRVVREHIGEIEIAGSPAGAAVTVNGVARGHLPLASPIRLEEGEAVVEMIAAGHVAAIHPTQVTGRNLKKLFLRLQPAGPTIQEKALATTVVQVASVRSGHDSRLKTLGVAVGAAGVLAVGLGIWKTFEVRAIQKAVGQETDGTKIADLNEEGRRAERWQWISYATGGVAVIAGALLFRKAFGMPEATVSMTVRPEGTLLVIGRRY